eukprot:4578803-Prymnesium_polylepis.1
MGAPRTTMNASAPQQRRIFSSKPPLRTRASEVKRESRPMTTTLDATSSVSVRAAWGTNVFQPKTPNTYSAMSLPLPTWAERICRRRRMAARAKEEVCHSGRERETAHPRGRPPPSSAQRQREKREQGARGRAGVRIGEPSPRPARRLRS